MTTPPDFRTRDTDAPQWWHDMRDLERTVLLAAMIVVIVSAALYGLAKSITVVDDFAANVITEVISIAIMVMVVRRLIWSDLKQHRKEAILLQIGSRDNGLACEAVRLAGLYGWLVDGSMENAHLSQANLRSAVFSHASHLEGVWLSHADLEGAYLHYAYLQGASLGNGKLCEASLVNAHLQDANLSNVDAREADLSEANLQRATLHKTNLSNARLIAINAQGADFSGAILTAANLVASDFRNAKLDRADLQQTMFELVKLQGADLRDAYLVDAHRLELATFDEKTILPDGTNWSPDVDMTRFTDPDHPDFWEPGWVRQVREGDGE